MDATTAINNIRKMLGLQFKKIEKHCGLDFILTTEGLYLAPIVNALPVLEKFDSFADTRGLMDLSLADEDFRALELINAEKNNA